jgi:hypothetical protein
MKTKSRKKVGVKPRSGQKSTSRRPQFYPLIYIDIEVAYSEGDKPYIGSICILGPNSEILVNEFFGDPREIESEQVNKILKLLHTNFAVCCDPTFDVRVIKSDARRCGIKAKPSKFRFIDIQLIEQQIVGKTSNRRIGLDKLAHKYRIKPPVKFHESFSDASVIKSVFEAQLKELSIDKEHLHQLKQIKK